MKIYTSYFGKLNSIPDFIVPITICGKAPDWYSGIQYKKLAPSYSIFSEYKQSYNKEIYRERFKKEILDKLNKEIVLKELEFLSGGKDVVLLCYEKPQDFCHRHIVADWLENIEEYKGENK